MICSWKQFGADIPGNFQSIAINKDADVVALVEETNVVTWAWNKNTWKQRGSLVDSNATSVSISDDGNTIAVVSGSYGRVYDWDSVWTQRGQDIVNVVDGVDISSSGNVVAFTLGVYEWNPFQHDWQPRGNHNGSLVSINDEGNVIAHVDIAAVVIYKWDQNQWTLQGDDIDVTNPVLASLSEYGDIVAIATTDSVRDSAQIWSWNDTGWIRRGENIISGNTVSLSASGNIVAVDGAAYKWNGQIWKPRGTFKGTSPVLSSDGQYVAAIRTRSAQIYQYTCDAKNHEPEHLKLFFWIALSATIVTFSFFAVLATLMDKVRRTELKRRIRVMFN